MNARKELNAARESELPNCLCSMGGSSDLRAAFLNSSSKMNTEQAEPTPIEPHGPLLDEVLAEGKEAWSADKIPFDVAVEVVKRHFAASIQQIKSLGYPAGRVSLAAQTFSNADEEPHFDFFASGYGQTETSMAKTLAEAVAGVPKREDDKTAQIKRLHAEIAKLESAQ